MTTLSNPAYHQLLIHLGQAKGHLDAAKRIADELVRDRMLVTECANLRSALNTVLHAEVQVKARSQGLTHVRETLATSLAQDAFHAEVGNLPRP